MDLWRSLVHVDAYQLLAGSANPLGIFVIREHSRLLLLLPRSAKQPDHAFGLEIFLRFQLVAEVGEKSRTNGTIERLVGRRRIWNSEHVFVKSAHRSRPRHAVQSAWVYTHRHESSPLRGKMNDYAAVRLKDLFGAGHLEILRVWSVLAEHGGSGRLLRKPGKIAPLRPTDVAEASGLLLQQVSRQLKRLEQMKITNRDVDGRGQVRIYLRVELAPASLGNCVCLPPGLLRCSVGRGNTLKRKPTPDHTG
jgi:hypothetical protein